jgi:steroid 5-alpha reductase family enzyme
MTTIWLIVSLAIGLSSAMAIAWQVILRTGNSGFADVFWSYSIGVAGLIAALAPIGETAPGLRNWIVAGLVAVWSLRLGTHILRRTLKGGDDPRYAQLRKEWGDNYRQQLLLFLQIQALAGFILALSAMAAAHNPAPFGWLDVLGIFVAIIAIGIEAISDAQLSRFKADSSNHGKVCDTGLWGLSRHPNYVGEVLYWVAFPLLAIGYGYGWFALAAPVMMYWLLVHVSGIPPLEAHMLRSRPDAFAAYQRRVRAFWPIPKANGESG